MFNRNPITPEFINAKVVSETDCFEIENPEVGMDTRTAEVTAKISKVIVCSLNYK